MRLLDGFFEGQNNLKLYYRSWLPDGEVEAILLIAHGVAEHCGRYVEMAKFFANKGYGVYGFDYCGHGKSEGRRVYVEHFSNYLDDLQTFSKIIRSLHPHKNVILFGHSMGAVLGLADIIYHHEEFSGLILSGVAIKPKPVVPIAIVAMLKPVALFMPRLGLYRIDSSVLSRDKRVIESYGNDPLVYRGKLTARLGIELLSLTHKLKIQMQQVKLPILILHGTEDKISCPEGASLVFRRVSSTDKTLKFYQGFYHEILNEPDKIRVLSDIEAWLSHLVAPVP